MTRLIAAVAVAALCSAPAVAQDAPTPLSLELNALQPSDKGCRITLVASNGLGTAIEKASFELALFGATGGIDRLVSLDFKGLAVGKTKVLQFELAGLDCAAVTRVLINDVTACDGAGLDPAACATNLVTSSRVDATFGV
ncbi:MAG: hypothetical protein ACOVO5_11330 [Devosia sp.]